MPEVLAGRDDRPMASAPSAGIRVADAPDRSRFEISVDGEVAGFTEYRRRPGLIAFIHTLIDPRCEGHGLATQLVREARSEGLSVLPFCPFVRSYIAGHAEYLDLAPKNTRAKFDLLDRAYALYRPRRRRELRPGALPARRGVPARAPGRLRPGTAGRRASPTAATPRTSCRWWLAARPARCARTRARQRPESCRARRQKS